MLTHSAVEQWKALIRFACKWHFLSIHKKCSLGWALLTNAMLLVCHVWSSATWTLHVGMFCSPFPPVHHHLLDFAGIQRKVIRWPDIRWPVTGLPPSSHAARDKTHHCSVIDEFDDDIWVVVGAQSCVNSAKRKGLSTQPYEGSLQWVFEWRMCGGQPSLSVGGLSGSCQIVGEDCIEFQTEVYTKHPCFSMWFGEQRQWRQLLT